MNHRHKGFTIIELLVVISIIGLLAAVATFAVSNARIDARNTRRIQDLQQIQTALELYFKDFKVYPPSSRGYNNWDGHCKGGGNWTGDIKYIPELVDKGYMAQLPVDPRFDTDTLGVAAGQCYAYNAKILNGQYEYKILAFGVMENICDDGDGDLFPDPGDTCNPQYIQAFDDPAREAPPPLPTIAIWSSEDSRLW